MFRISVLRLLGAAALSSAASFAHLPLAHAHATLETPQVAPGASYKAVVRIPHGCDGQATHTVRVSIPHGMHAVKPMPKPGWTLATREADYPTPVKAGRNEVRRGVVEVVWSGGNLPDEHYDEFVLRGSIGSAVTEERLFFPIVQECAGGRVAWTEIPAPGQDPHALKRPAAGLRIVRADAPAAATSVSIGALRIEAPWTRATPAGARVAGGYLKIANTGSTADRLVGGSFPLAGRFEVHEMAVTDGVMTMRHLPDGLEIEPGQTVELKPGGFHLMFLDLKQQVKAGAPLKGTLVFEKAGTVEVEYSVAPIGARGPAEGHSHH